MKKFYYLIAMAIMAFTFTSCEDVPAPFGQPVHISGDTEDDPSGGDDSGLAVNEDFKAAGKLTWSVTNVVAPDGVDVWQYDSRYGLKATAYAGGANNAAESWLICPEPYNFSNVSGAKMTIKHAANYFSDGAEKECKVLASTDYSKSVADATWTEIKIDTWPTSWDFVEGTGDMSAFDGKDKVYIAFKYTSTATKSGTWEIESIKVEGGGSSSGGGSDTPTPTGGTIFEESFATGQGNFTIDDKTLGEGLTFVWKHDATNKYMKASAYSGGNKDAESWLVSPEINLSTATKPVLTFSQVINKYFGTVANEAMVYVKKDGGEWTKVTITFPTTVPAANWSKFTDEGADQSVDLTAFKSSKTQIAFVYKSSTSAAGTWEIKNVKVAEPAQ